MAVSVTQLGLPKGRPRLTQQRNAATSASVCGCSWLTSCSQSVGEADGAAHSLVLAKRGWPSMSIGCGNAAVPVCKQGKAIYEKGGLNLANLTDEQQIEAEDDYRICVRRGRDEETKPRRQRPNTTEDDQEETTMTRTLYGKVHGKTIELDEDLGVAEGQEVEVHVRMIGPKKRLPGPPPGWRPGGTETAAGMMAEHWTEEDDRILEAIERDRHRPSTRKLLE